MQLKAYEPKKAAGGRHEQQIILAQTESDKK